MFYKHTAVNRIRLVSHIILYFRTSFADQRDQIRYTTVVSSNEYFPPHNMAIQVNYIAIKSNLHNMKKYSFILFLRIINTKIIARIIWA